MGCPSCGSEEQDTFRTEIAIHLKHIAKPHIFVFPDILICLKCGKPEFDPEFALSENELRLLAKSDAARG